MSRSVTCIAATSASPAGSLPRACEPRRHVYVCTAGTLNVRNHLAVRDVLRSHDDLREAYAAVQALAADPEMDIDTYLAGKSAVLQQVSRPRGR